MTPTQLLGYAILATPFVTLFVMFAREAGIKVALALFGSVALFFALIWIGSTLAIG